MCACMCIYAHAHTDTHTPIFIIVQRTVLETNYYEDNKESEKVKEGQYEQNY